MSVGQAASYTSIIAAEPPRSLLTVVVDEQTFAPPFSALCAGYERGEWRCEPFAEHLMEWLLDFVFPDDELAAISSSSAREALRRAARQLYQTDKYRRRGEFGELLLHVVLRQHFNSVPAIRKIYFKDSPNDTVKGFDAVHVVAHEDSHELWLGEVKFYSDLADAMRTVIAELTEHSATDYLRTEFALILNKLDAQFPHADRLRRLLSPTTSLDEVFTTFRIPVLLTYDSTVTARHTSMCEEYLSEVREELLTAHEKFAGDGLPVGVALHLILIPLATKEALVTALHAKLEGLQR
jgi:hypothetical protein